MHILDVRIRLYPSADTLDTLGKGQVLGDWHCAHAVFALWVFLLGQILGQKYININKMIRSVSGNKNVAGWTRHNKILQI
jgi:hypothetical protein